MDSENPADHVFVDLDTEGQPDLLGNPLAAPRAIAAFHCDDRGARKEHTGLTGRGIQRMSISLTPDVGT